jgi:hypothetical protein
MHGPVSQTTRAAEAVPYKDSSLLDQYLYPTVCCLLQKRPSPSPDWYSHLLCSILPSPAQLHRPKQSQVTGSGSTCKAADLT